MAITCICFVLFVIILPRIDSELCISKTESGREKSVCCADYEAKHNECMPCPKGYTSYAGQNCRPCSHNTYGERCRYDCSCSVFEVCNFVHGCILDKTTTGISVDETSEHSTYTVAIETTTLYKYDATTTHNILDESTTGKSSDNRVNGSLSTEMIFNIALSVIVVLFGVCLCFIFYKVEFVAKWKRPTCFRSGIPQERQCDNSIEMDDRLYHEYNIINDADVLDDLNLQRMQIQMSTDYIDVIRSSNSIASSKSKSEVSYGIPCQDLPSGGTKTYENNVDFRSWISGDSISSSSNEHQNTTQDYLNLYQPLLKVAQPKREEYLKLVSVNRTDSISVDYQTSVISTNEHALTHPLQLEACLLWQHYENEHVPIKFELTHFERFGSRIKGRVSKSCDNLASNRLQKKASSKKGDKLINSFEYIAYNNTFRWKSESDIFCKHNHNFNKKRF